MWINQKQQKIVFPYAKLTNIMQYDAQLGTEHSLYND